ncbi:MAG: hypothetical protein HeimC3_49830 [Candidatus Heimdallarchaeota archaeon LC_3]|nr:MAG: hypothetical protein HeimC3_49830 [Candidatus Heimdallarchaeota archaeon LC_3]
MTLIFFSTFIHTQILVSSSFEDALRPNVIGTTQISFFSYNLDRNFYNSYQDPITEIKDFLSDLLGYDNNNITKLISITKSYVNATLSFRPSFIFGISNDLLMNFFNQSPLLNESIIVTNYENSTELLTKNNFEINFNPNQEKIELNIKSIFEKSDIEHKYFDLIMSIFYFSGEADLIFVNYETILSYLKNDKIDQVGFNIFLNFDQDLLYHLLYYSESFGDLEKIRKGTISIVNEFYGSFYHVDNSFEIFDHAINFEMQVRNINLIWYGFTFPLLLILLILIFFIINDSYFDKINLEILKIRGVSNFQLISYFLLELTSFFIISHILGMIFGNIIQYFLFSNFSKLTLNFSLESFLYPFFILMSLFIVVIISKMQLVKIFMPEFNNKLNRIIKNMYLPRRNTVTLIVLLIIIIFYIFDTINLFKSSSFIFIIIILEILFYVVLTYNLFLTILFFCQFLVNKKKYNLFFKNPKFLLLTFINAI